MHIYEEHIQGVENDSFFALVFSTSDGMGKAATTTFHILYQDVLVCLQQLTLQLLRGTYH